jgi:hypothetical protein
MSNEISNTDTPTPEPPPPARNPWRTFSITLIVLLVLGGVGYWLVSVYLFPSAFTPVTLNQKEQQRLDAKLDRLSGQRGTLTPEKYSEDPAKRTIEFSEKELNALLAKNTDLASKLAIDLSDNLASAKLLIDVDPDAPILGGQTVKVTAGMELSIKNGQPRAVLKGVSVWGVPLPNAWIGNMKNRDMMAEFGQAGGFWQAIREGVDEIEVREGKLRIRLKE